MQESRSGIGTFAAVLIRAARGLALPATIPQNRFWRRWDARRIAPRPIGAELQSGAYRLEPRPLSAEVSGPQAGWTLGPQPRPRCADVTCSVQTREPKGRRGAIASAGGSLRAAFLLPSTKPRTGVFSATQQVTDRQPLTAGLTRAPNDPGFLATQFPVSHGALGL